MKKKTILLCCALLCMTLLCACKSEEQIAQTAQPQSYGDLTGCAYHAGSIRA